MRELRLRLLSLRAVPLLLLLLLGTTQAKGQAQDPPQDDYGRYSQAAGRNLPIYRGELALGYNLLYNGTYTWDLKGFQSGDLMYGGKLYHGIIMDINAEAQQLLLKETFSDLFSVEARREEVESFTRGDEKWVNLHDYGNPEAPVGFLQVLYDGEEGFYLRIDKIFQQAVNAHPDMFGPMNKPVDPRTTNLFEHKVTYYLRTTDGNLVKVRKARGFLKYHKDRKRAIVQHCRSLGIPEKDLELWAVEALNYIEGNGHE